MRAVAKVAPEADGIEICSVPEPRAGAHEVKIRVTAAGICGTDLQIYDWAPRMARRMVLARIMGHEVCGTVVALGAGVTGLEVGERVALEGALQGFELIRAGQALKPLLVPDATDATAAVAAG